MCVHLYYVDIIVALMCENICVHTGEADVLVCGVINVIDCTL